MPATASGPGEPIPGQPKKKNKNNKALAEAAVVTQNALTTPAVDVKAPTPKKKNKKGPFYVVAVGRVIGVYDS